MTQPGPKPDNPDNYIDALLEGAPPAAAAVALAGLVNRASARLHTLARGQASAYKGQAEWPAWAQLQNAARALVLQASTCRDLTARLPADTDTKSSADPSAASQGPPGAEPAATDPPRQPTSQPADAARPGGDAAAPDEPRP